MQDLISATRPEEQPVWLPTRRVKQEGLSSRWIKPSKLQGAGRGEHEKKQFMSDAEQKDLLAQHEALCLKCLGDLRTIGYYKNREKLWECPQPQEHDPQLGLGKAQATAAAFLSTMSTQDSQEKGYAEGWRVRPGSKEDKQTLINYRQRKRIGNLLL